MTPTPGQPVRVKIGRRWVSGTLVDWRMEERRVAHIITPDGKHRFLPAERLESKR